MKVISTQNECLRRVLEIVQMAGLRPLGDLNVEVQIQDIYQEADQVFAKAIALMEAFEQGRPAPDL